MREIKFKYYWQYDDKVTSKIVTLADIEVGLLHIHKIIRRVQYTGLKDKNGTEIYEGDIVHITDKNNHRQVWSIEWGYFGDTGYYVQNHINSGRELLPSDYGGHGSFTISDEEIPCIVLGNIYEDEYLFAPTTEES